MREVVSAVLRHRTELHKDGNELDGWFSDLYDHAIRAAEWSESLRDMLTSIFETSLSLQDARLNTVMKKLTAWAAIIAVPTAVTGWFGQNVPYPGSQQPAGVIASTVLILGIAVSLYVVFKRKAGSRFAGATVAARPQSLTGWRHDGGRSRGDVAVIGTGAMGAGIAQVAATAGHRVYLQDAGANRAAAAVEGLNQRLTDLAAKGRLTVDQAGTPRTGCTSSATCATSASANSWSRRPWRTSKSSGRCSPS